MNVKKQIEDIEDLQEMDDIHDSDLYTGTTIVGICADNATIVATDKQVTGHNVAGKNEKMDKIHPKAVIAGSGLAAHCQKIIRDARSKTKEYEIKRGRQMSVESLTKDIVNDMSSGGLFPEYFCKPMVGGYENNENILLSLGFFGYKDDKDDYATVGSGSHIALGYLESNFEYGLSVEDAEDLAIDTLKCVSRKGVYTGEGIDIAVIDDTSTEIKRDYAEL